MPIFVCRKFNPNLPNGYKDFNDSRNKILSWLVSLKNNNRHYADITIDYDALNTLPYDSSTYDSLSSCSLDDDLEEDGALEDSSNQSNTTRPLLDEENIYIFQYYTYINPLL